MPIEHYPPFVLATDLDGTLLDGSMEDRLALKAGLAEARATVIYATGRNLELVLAELNNPTLPRADYLVADVGATVLDGRTHGPVPHLQDEILLGWRGIKAVRRALRDFTRLTLQPVPQANRCSYYTTPDALSPELLQTIEGLGCDWVYSANKYLDIVPKGASKGSSLRKLLAWLRLPLERVVVAGDTLNDLSLFELGTNAIAVANAEAPLIERLGASSTVYHARRAATGGVVEGLVHYRRIRAPKPLGEVLPRPTPGAEAGPLIVYHRVPFEPGEGGGLVPPKQPNGIIPSLLSYFEGRSGTWIASREGVGSDKLDVSDAPRPYQSLKLKIIEFTRAEIDAFYKKLSKDALWPILHSFAGKAVFNREHWEVYRKVNERFAAAIASTASPGQTTWIHDYNLWLTPGMARVLRPDLRLAFFHHTPFPHSTMFNILPWRREILGSLLHCDYIGFHTPRDVENFVDSVRSLTSVKVLKTEPSAPRFHAYGCASSIDSFTSAIQVDGRVVRFGVHPIGVNVNKISRLLHEPAIQEKIAEWRRRLTGKCIVTAGRVDYTKGFPELLRAYDRLLIDNPDLRGTVNLLIVCAPPAKGMDAYAELDTELDRLCGMINGKHGTDEWIPVRYFHRALPFEELIPLFVVGDVALITPLRDGMNLVAKEYVATKLLTEAGGTLVLSEFAGAAAELRGAMLTNPYDQHDLQETLLRALRLSPTEQALRWMALREVIESNSGSDWGADFLRAAQRKGETPEPPLA